MTAHNESVGSLKRKGHNGQTTYFQTQATAQNLNTV